MVLAHGSGLDDAAFTLLPLLFFAAVLFRAKRRAEREHEDHASATVAGEELSE